MDQSRVRARVKVRARFWVRVWVRARVWVTTNPVRNGPRALVPTMAFSKFENLMASKF